MSPLRRDVWAEGVAPGQVCWPQGQRRDGPWRAEMPAMLASSCSDWTNFRFASTFCVLPLYALSFSSLFCRFFFPCTEDFRFFFRLSYVSFTLFTLHAGSGTRAHPEKRQSRKAAMERSSRKAAKPPWNAQAAKPQSRKLWDSCAVSCVHRRCGYTRAPWKASKPQSRHGTLKPQSCKAAMERWSRKAAKPPWNAEAAKPPMERSSRKAAKPQVLRLMRCLLRSSPLRCHRHGALKPQSRKLWELRLMRRVLCSSPLCCQRFKKRQRAAKHQGIEAPRSVKAAKLREAPKRQEAPKLPEASKRRSVQEPPTKGLLCLDEDGLAYGKRSATKGLVCLAGYDLACGNRSAMKGLLCFEGAAPAYGQKVCSDCTEYTCCSQSAPITGHPLHRAHLRTVQLQRGVWFPKWM